MPARRKGSKFRGEIILIGIMILAIAVSVLGYQQFRAQITTTTPTNTTQLPPLNLTITPTTTPATNTTTTATTPATPLTSTTTTSAGGAP